MIAKVWGSLKRLMGGSSSTWMDASVTVFVMKVRTKEGAGRNKYEEGSSHSLGSSAARVGKGVARDDVPANSRQSRDETPRPCPGPAHQPTHAILLLHKETRRHKGVKLRGSDR